MTIPPTQDPRTDTRTDAELLADYVAGDANALAVLVHRYQRLLLRLVRCVSWSEPDPEAVVQEVWLRVLKNAATFKGQAKVSTWLHRITVNEALSAARRRRANRATPVGELHESHEQPHRAEGGDPSSAVLDREQAAATLPVLLAMLPREQRLVLEVLYLDGLTHTEAAELFGVSVGTIKSRASRAQSAIRALLAASPSRQDHLGLWARSAR
ncbi:ECF RNA polymerase sigma factor SigM [Actinomycetospora sp. NBRC 106375]|uniref:RNA polymerase sigma factor n=1 Tax=Actinomycetospora sp. NBRC 106375 TaxID=3032207 RepID=UPI0024A52CBB|nr:sigma-70 family RNA polymerase sigma factor [Actinomycetospora sp. NBRC 106375]GLZ50326.1 ECF RNA polymerase sigma factor SigM [Actinomycetospora sp. NBRC 106375]